MSAAVAAIEAEEAATNCKTCLFLQTLSGEEHVDWAKAVNTAGSASAVARAITKRSDISVTESSVKRHRNRRHA